MFFNELKKSINGENQLPPGVAVTESSGRA
jgi:hypothetical protein